MQSWIEGCRDEERSDREGASLSPLPPLGSLQDWCLGCDQSLAISSFLLRVNEAAVRASVGVPLSILH